MAQSSFDEELDDELEELFDEELEDEFEELFDEEFDEPVAPPLPALPSSLS